MSSAVVVSCSQGFVVSTDSIAFKLPVGEKGPKLGRLKGSTRKLFQLSDDVLAAGVGEWNQYFPVMNEVARKRLPTDKLVPELLELCAKKTADSRVFVLSRQAGKVVLDISELGHIRKDLPGAHAYPDPLLNDLFSRVYESPEGLAIRKTGMLGIASLVAGFNAMAASLSPEMSQPFDSVCFLPEGLFVLSGGVTKLPVAELW
jgi:hypothetical protein